MQFEVFTLQQRPDLEDQVERLHEDTWDEFLQGAPWNYWETLFDEFADYQILFCDADGTLAGLGHTVPFDWDGTIEDLPPTLDDVIKRGLDARRDGRRLTTLSALAAVVPATHQKQGLSSRIIEAMRNLAQERNLESVVVPVGPTFKHLYPITPMERYVRWKRPDGTPFDPWIRVHWKLGAEHLCVAPRTAIATGTVAQWEEWTGMSFPETGEYIVPGALQPVHIDREKDLGRYEDPGVWMRHRITNAA